MKYYHQNTLSPTQELQAIINEEDLERDLHIQLQKNGTSPNFVINNNFPPNQLETGRSNEMGLLNKTAQKTGVSLMAFFFVKRFIQKIRSNRQKLQNVNQNHLQLINDQGSDNQVMLTQMKFGSPAFQIKNVSRLFRQQTLIRPENPWIIAIKDKNQRFKKWIYERISKIPQFHPESPKRLLWDYFTTIIRLILLILIPLEIAYAPSILFDYLLPLSVILIVILMLDILIRLNTICYVKGHAVIDRTEIIKYKITKIIIIDLTTIIPFLFFCIRNEGSRYYQLILLTSVLQFKYINDVIQKSEESQYFTKSQKGIISLTKLILTLMYILHIFSCIWFFNSSLNMQDNWIEFKNLDTQDWATQYLEAFYFAIVTMLTIGYGDNVPKTINEKIVAIFFIMGACLWFSYSVNTIGIIIKEINQNMVERVKKIRVINRYMHKRRIPYSLQYRIREYLNFRWKEEAEIDLKQEEQLLKELSEELKQELKQQSNGIFFSHCQFLSQNFSLEFQNALSGYITRIIIQPQNSFSIFTLNEIKQPHLCFVEQGQLQYLNKDKVSLKGTQSQGLFLQVQDFITENDNTQIFKAIGYVSLLTLSKSDFLQVLSNYPKDYQHYCVLRDNINLSVLKKQLSYGVQCPACNCNEHDLLNCPQIKVSLDREVVIKRHLFTQNQSRQQFKRSEIRSKDLFLTLNDREIIEQFALCFQNEKFTLLKKQLQQQLVFELQDDEIVQIKQDQDQRDELQPPFQPIIMRKQDSILLSQNFSSSNNLPQPTSPNYSMLNSQQQKKKPGLLDSQSSYGNAKSVKKIAYDFDLKPPPPLNRYTTAKLSMYKKNYLTKQQQQQQLQQLQASFISADQNIIQEFNEMIQQQIEQLYWKMKKLQISEQLESGVDPIQIEMLYLQQKREQYLNQFECVKSFELYMPENNIDKVLLDQKNKSIPTFSFHIPKFINYMYFPYEYIMKFQKLQQLERSHKSIKIGQQRRGGLSISKIVELKNVFQRKRVTPRRSVKISQVNPGHDLDSEF